MVCHEQDFDFYDLGQGHFLGSNFVNFDDIYTYRQRWSCLLLNLYA
jgi:hypothetical protein